MAEAPTQQGLLSNQSFGTIAPYEPNMVERAQGLLAQGLMKFGYDPRDAYVQANKIINTQGDVGAADFTPIAGDLIGAQDAYDMGVDAKRAFERNEYLKSLGYGAGSAATGVLSGLGVLGTVAPPVDKAIDAARVGVKKVTGLLNDVDNIVTGAERDANFKNWFGDSKVVDEAGEPLTVYHGTKKNFDTFKTNYADGLSFFSRDPDFASKWSEGTGGLREATDKVKESARAAKDYERSLFDKYTANGELDIPAGSEFNKAYDEVYGKIRKDMQAKYGVDRAHLIETQSDVSVMPVNLSIQKPFDPRKDYKEVESLLSEMPSMKGVVEEGLHKNGNWVVYENKEVIDALKKKGYDGIYLAENVGGAHDTIATFYPEQIKSIHNRGTYDPKDANILKGIAPIAGAGLLGAGMMRQEDQQPQQGILN